MSEVVPQLLDALERRLVSELPVRFVSELTDFPWRTHREFSEEYRAGRAMALIRDIEPAVKALSDRVARVRWRIINCLPLVVAVMGAIAAALMRDLSVLIGAIPLLALHLFAAGRLTFLFQTLPLFIVCGFCFKWGSDRQAIVPQVSSVVGVLGLIPLCALRAWPSMLVEEAMLISEPVLLWLVTEKLIEVRRSPESVERLPPDGEKLTESKSQ